MSSGDSALSGLQFDRVEAINSAPSNCASCGSPVGESYYALNGLTLCPPCAEVHRPLVQEPSSQDYLRAALYGAGAALAGTAGYFAILALSGYEIGLIAVAVGWLVGKAVQKGSRGIGGRKLQVMAVVLTYLSIVGSYVPLTVKYALEQRSGQERSTSKKGGSNSSSVDGRESPAAVSEPAPVSASSLIVGLLIVFAFCLVSPFLHGFSSIIGLFIIFIGLFEAWKLNRRTPLVLEGPFTVARPDARAE